MAQFGKALSCAWMLAKRVMKRMIAFMGTPVDMVQMRRKQRVKCSVAPL
jgi:hypothetical protein